MTITETTVAPLIEAGVGMVSPVDLHKGLTAVLPFAGTDDTLPMLCAVEITSRDGYLTFATTDRYTLGTYRVKWEGGDVNALLPAKEAKELARFAKDMAREYRTVGEALIVSLKFTERDVQADVFGRRVTLPLMQDVMFVKWRAILPDEDALKQETGRIDMIGLNPTFLARFAKVPAGRGEPMRLILGASALKPALVKIGDDFTGLIMPVRIDR